MSPTKTEISEPLQKLDSLPKNEKNQSPFPPAISKVKG